MTWGIGQIGRAPATGWPTYGVGIQRSQDKARVMKRCYVITPEYEYTGAILEDGSGPREWGCDVVEVQARTKREAKILGLRELRKIRKGWINWCRDTDSNPFTGLKVELIEEEEVQEL